MANFGNKFGRPCPHLNPMHNLYIYPQSVNFTNYPTKYGMMEYLASPHHNTGKVKSILTRVYFLKNDDDVDINNRCLAVCVIFCTAV